MAERKRDQANNPYHAIPVAVTRGSGLGRLINVLRVGRLKGYKGKYVRKRCYEQNIR